VAWLAVKLAGRPVERSAAGSQETECAKVLTDDIAVLENIVMCGVILQKFKTLEKLELVLRR